MSKRMMAAVLGVCMLGAAGAPVSHAAKKIKKEKLQIVLCLGQSNMVGLSDARTAWYLTQPQYIPPRDVTVMKSRFFNWNFYWNGVNYYEGPHKDEAMALVQARRDSRAKWRQRCKGVHGPWLEAEWGPKPAGGRGNMYPFLDGKAEEEGIYKLLLRSSTPMRISSM